MFAEDQVAFAGAWVESIEAVGAVDEDDHVGILFLTATFAKV